MSLFFMGKSYNLSFAGSIGYGQYIRENDTYTGMLGEIQKGVSNNFIL